MNECFIKLQAKTGIPDKFGRQYRLNVYIDGKKVGAIAGGAEEIFEIAPGNHFIYANTSFRTKTRSLETYFSSGETKSFECGQSGIALYPLFGMLCCTLIIVLFLNTRVELHDPKVRYYAGYLLYSGLFWLILCVINFFIPGCVYYLKQQPQNEHRDLVQ